jgi:hypothetical protein
VLAEGIETEDDLATAQALGARWGQGWLFGRPGPLSAVAGWPVHQYARLRAPRPDLHVPSGTPFGVAAVRHYSRAGDQRMVDGLTEHLFSLASRGGAHTVVLGAYPDATVGRAWLPRLASVAGTAAFVGAVGPELTGADPHPVRLAASAPGLADAETVLAVVSPYATVALCVRPDRAGGLDFVLTHDRDVVHTVARMLLWRLEAVGDRPADRVPVAR